MGARTLVPSDRDHVVYFYDREAEAVAIVASYLTAALLDGDTVRVFATPEHRRAFVAAIAAAGVEVGVAEADGRLLLHDAAQTLEQFMVDGAPDETRFEATVGDAVRGASASGRPVRAYGEMVALLWASGRADAALHLERLWNELAERTPFSLFCGYPRALVAGATDPDAVTNVCRLHTALIGTAPVPEGVEKVRHFAPTARGPGLARRFVGEAMQDWGLPELSDDLALVVGELATNAVVHGRSAFTVAVSRVRGGVRVVVGDCNTASPRVRQFDSDRAEGGRGLVLVEAVAQRWGHDAVANGKLVWAELSVKDDHEVSRAGAGYRAG